VPWLGTMSTLIEEHTQRKVVAIMKLSQSVRFMLFTLINFAFIYVFVWGIAFAFSYMMFVPWLGVVSPEYHTVVAVVCAFIFQGLVFGPPLVGLGLTTVAAKAQFAGSLRHQGAPAAWIRVDSLTDTESAEVERLARACRAGYRGASEKVRSAPRLVRRAARYRCLPQHGV